jgi:hypothetical protein
VPPQIRTIQPKLRREFNGIEIFTGAIVEDLVMIPVSAGEFELPSVKFVYFDPKKKAYETIETKPPKILVTKGASGLSISTPPGAASPVSTPSGKQPMPAGAGRPNQPLQYGAPALPRDPLVGTGAGFPPISMGWLKMLSILPWLVLLGVWWMWAKRRTVLTDPERSRKESLELWKISAVGVGASSEDYVQRERTLLVWQKAVAGTLGVEGATPSWEDIIHGGPTLLEADRNELEKCWMESEDALYGKGRTLAESWSARAMALAQRIDLPRIKIWETLRPRNVLPWGSLILLLWAGGLQIEAAETNGVVAQEKAVDPVGMYRVADFKGAEKIWSERVRLKSTDPIARNDLALANYQLGDKERALAHGLSAYLIAPTTESVAWNLRIFAGAADQLDPAINRLGDDSWTAGLTARLGVFAWQAILVAGIALAALGGGFWLASGYYGFYRRLFFRLGSGIVLVGAVMALLSGLALGVYGKLAYRGAVMIVDVEPLRSIPSELEPQAEKAYPPGSIAHLEKSFLGWSKIRLPNHDMGWIRAEHIVPLY